MTLKEKLLTVGQHYDLSKTELARRLGIAKSNFISDGLLSELNSGILVKFCAVFPDVNADWLLRDKQPMLLSDIPVKDPPQPAHQETNVNNGVNLGKIGSDHTTGDADERPAGQKTDKKESPCVTCGKTDCIFLQAKQEVIDAQKITIETLRSR